MQTIESRKIYKGVVQIASISEIENSLAKSEKYKDKQEITSKLSSKLSA